MGAAFRCEEGPAVKHPRLAEMIWLGVLLVLVAAGGGRILHVLAARRAIGAALLLLAVAATVVMIRRAYDPASPTVRTDVTAAVGYCCSAVLALVAVAGSQEWAVGSAIIALVVSLAFEIVTIAAGSRAVGGR